MPTTVIQIFVLLITAAAVAFAWTPAFTAFLYRHRLGKQIRDEKETPIYSALHAKKAGTPTLGGILIWGTAIIALAATWIVGKFVPAGFWHTLTFWSRSETYLPIGMMLLAAAVGLVDDLFNIKRRGAHGGGLRMRHRLLIYSAIALVGAWWFFAKLGWSSLHLPFVGGIDIGWWYIPFFVFIIVATSFSVNEADGLDGLAGGLLLANFTTIGAIAVIQGKYDLAGLVAVIVGALVAFLWFNIPPARFMMGDTGAMSMGVTLGVMAMLTNTALLLPVIALPFLIESISVIIQLLSKRFRHKKVFLSAPIHHHFEAKGWSESKIVMRAWVIAALTSVVGLILFLVDRSF